MVHSWFCTNSRAGSRKAGTQPHSEQPRSKSADDSLCKEKKMRNQLIIIIKKPYLIQGIGHILPCTPSTNATSLVKFIACAWHHELSNLKHWLHILTIFSLNKHPKSLPRVNLGFTEWLNHHRSNSRLYKTAMGLNHGWKHNSLKNFTGTSKWRQISLLEKWTRKKQHIQTCMPTPNLTYETYRNHYPQSYPAMKPLPFNEIVLLALLVFFHACSKDTAYK